MTENTITVTNEGSEGLSQVPVQIGRVFRYGEIQHYPVVVGAQTFQSDIKCRYWDGSVKHAIITFEDDFASGETKTYHFEDADVFHGGGASLATILDRVTPSITIGDTEVCVTDAGIRVVDRWLNGPLCTTVILAGHDGAEDVDAVRPIFHISHFRNYSKVRFIGESANVNNFKDQTYDLSLDVNGSEVYRQDGFMHQAGARWTFVSAGEWNKLKIDHNLPYLVSTKVFPNYDLSKTVPVSAVNKMYSDWSGSNKLLGKRGLWTPPMGNSGGRPDIGLMPEWSNKWLYTFDRKMEEVSLGQADLAANWPYHLRKQDGDMLKLEDRPSLCLWICPISVEKQREHGTVDADLIVPTGPVADTGWEVESAHQPDIGFPQYVLTGDYFYLEEIQFLSAYSAFFYRAGVPWGRGPSGKEGGIHGEPRGDGWDFRNRVQAAWITPDEDPMKTYLHDLVRDAISVWEGIRDIPMTYESVTSLYNWAKSCINAEYNGLGVPPLHHWRKDGGGGPESPVDPDETDKAMSPWMECVAMSGLWRAKELGYPVDALVKWFAEHFTGIATHPECDPHIMGVYRIPVTAEAGHYFQFWPDLMNGFESGYNFKADFEGRLGDPEHGYCYLTLPALAACYHQQNGVSAWNTLTPRLLARPELNQDPKWAVLPRLEGLLAASDYIISASKGENNITLYIRPGAQYAGSKYVVMASLTGTCPPMNWNGPSLPIAKDAVTNLSLQSHSPWFSGFSGVLSADGATAQVTVPGDVANLVKGKHLYLAYGILGPHKLVSNPISLRITD